MPFKRITNQGKSGALANATWTPSVLEEEALAHHNYVNGLSRVDQIWQPLAKKHGNLIAIDAPHSFCREKFSYLELSRLISQAASAFRRLGVNDDDVAALFAENSPRWLVADQALMRVGACDAVRGASAPLEELRYILDDCGAIALIVQNADLWEKLALSSSQKKRLRIVVQLEGDPVDGVIGWDDFLGEGEEEQEKDQEFIPNNESDSALSKVATILYTSGTTGKPKGVPLTHANLLHQVRSLACIAYPSPGSPVLSVLPIWHAYERSAEYYFFSCACTQSYTTIKHLKDDLPRVKPVVMATVPRLWEAVQSGFYDAVKGMPISRQYLLKIALANSGAYKIANRKARSIWMEKISLTNRVLAFVESSFRWPMHAMASSLLWPKVIKKLCGGDLRFPINGGGAIAPHVDLFFESLGIELLVGYGLTETSPVVSCRRPWRNIRGSSGTPLPDTEFRIVDPETGFLKFFREQGRVLVKGPQVMTGYLGKPEATSKVLDQEGWFDTGDLGMLLPDGSLVLTGRAKDTIVLSSGENIEPGPLEETLVASPFIEQVMLVGQDQRQLGALVVPKTDLMLSWAENNGLVLSEDLGGSPGDKNLRAILRREINSLLAKRKGSRPDERVFGVALVSPFTIDNGLLTQTLKQRRGKICDRDKDAIASIYIR